MKKTNPLYIVTEELFCGTAEDDIILGYFKTKEEAKDFCERENKEAKHTHYSFREIFEL